MHLKISNLTKSFGQQKVLAGIDLDIRPGESYGLIGANGAGKSTLIHLILGLLAPDEGVITFDGQTLSGNAEIPLRKKIGFVINEDTLLYELSGKEYLHFVGTLYDIPPTVQAQRIASLSQFFFENPEDLNKRIAAYSTGMKQKMRICAALIIKPEILVLDEPFNGLDPLAAKQMLTCLQNYIINHTLLISSHHLSLLEHLCSHVAILRDGQFAFCGTLETLLAGKEGLDQQSLALLQSHEFSNKHLSWLE